MAQVKVIACVGGKGGVGKSTVTLGLGYALTSLGYRVGLIDLDLESSSLGDALGLTHEKLAFHDLIEPVAVNGLKAVSLSLFPGNEWEDVPTLLHEERVYRIVEQMFRSVNWGELDYLLLDHPPGTGPELRGLAKHGVDGLVLVTAVQRLAEMPVRRLVRMAREEFKLPIIGVVSNDPYNVAGSAPNGSDAAYQTSLSICNRYGLNLIGSIAWDPAIVQAMDRREPLPAAPFLMAAKFVDAYFNPEKYKAKGSHRARGRPRKAAPAQAGAKAEVKANA